MSSVVICAYTTERWGPVARGSGVRSRSIGRCRDRDRRRSQRRPAGDVRGQVATPSRGRQSIRAGSVRRSQHRCRAHHRRCHRVPRRRCNCGQRVARCADRRIHRCSPSAVSVATSCPQWADASAELAAAGVLVGRWMQLRRAADRGTGDPKPDRRQHGVHAGRCSNTSVGSARRSAGSARSRWAARRPSCRFGLGPPDSTSGTAPTQSFTTGSRPDD